MATFSYPISASFGAAKTGLAASVGYKILSADGTSRVTRTTSGISERVDSAGNATTGVYDAVVTLNSAWGQIRIIWDITGQAGVVAEETINAAEARASSSATYVQALVVNFGAAKAGLSASVAYKVLGADGSTKIARTGVGVTERVDAAGNPTTGVYGASPTFNRSWGVVRVVWDITGQAGVVAEESIDTSDAIAIAGGTPGTPGVPYIQSNSTNVIADFTAVWAQLTADVNAMLESLYSPTLDTARRDLIVQMYSHKIERLKALHMRAIKEAQELNPQIALITTSVSIPKLY